ncbi:uncharacterized protein LOC129003340 [Macrosteles quadrilineatus]|uniref:uncharacterized protein LOC129003340 n=1 Tax=Macrosteles quadrilineatus TaxID=74068 RepID=UPI0023E33B1B|nr:uncharacterized protein LOC129003340 [Macrosteles quadrilineatus]
MTEDSSENRYKCLYLQLLTNTKPYWRHKKKPLYIRAITSICQFNQSYLEANSDYGRALDWDTYPSITDIKITFNDTLDNLKSKKSETNPSVYHQVVHNTLNQIWKDSLKIFSDGSKTTDGTGAAIWIPHMNLERKFKLPLNASIYTAEQFALFECTKILKEIPQDNVLICSDSQSAIKALKNIKNGLIKDNMCLEIIRNCLLSEKEISFQWIPSHIGLKHNETVDQLAKQAVTEGTEVKDISLPISDLKAYQKKRLLKQRNIRLQVSTKAAWYRTIQNNSMLRPWYFGQKMTRSEMINIIRLRIGIANVNKHLHKIKQYFTPLCILCTNGVTETIEHLLLECPHYDYARAQCFRRINKFPNDNTFEKVRKILASEDVQLYKEINSFLKVIKRRI